MKLYYPLLCYYPSQAGGPANTIFWLNEALAKFDFSSSITSTSFGLNNEDSEALDNLFNSKNKVRFVRNAFGFFSFREVRTILQSDIIHFSSLFFSPTLFLLIIGIISNKKIILSPRGELYPDALNKSKIKKKIYLKFFSLFVSKIVFHATNDVEVEHLKKILPNSKDVFVLPNLMPFEKDSSIQNNFRVLFLGRINEIKNLDKLIVAIHLLKIREGKKVELNIGGESRIESERIFERKIRTLIKKLDLVDQINFLGQVNGINKSNLLQQSCCLVLPSKSENFGNVVIEALSYGTPVIASKGTPWCSLEEEGVGFWVDPIPDLIADKINFYLNLSTNEYKKIGLKGKKFVLDNFEISRNIYKWEKIYNEL